MDESEGLLSYSSYRPAPPIFPQLLATAISCIGAVLFGYSLGYSSPAIPLLYNDGLLQTDDLQSWFGSIITLGAILGGPIAGALVNVIGRKTTVMACSLPYVIGWLLLILGENNIVLLVGRFVCGIGVGMSSLSVPLYIGEVSTKEYRGALGAGFQLSVTIGVLMAYGFGFCLNWQWLAIVGSWLSFVLLICMLIVPETPRFLLTKQRTDDALKSLKWLRGRNINVDAECQEIIENLDSSETTMELSEIFKRAIFLPLVISLCLMVFQQLSGVNAVIFYAQSIFAEAGFKGDPHLPAVIVGSVQVAATFVSCILMDRLGRKVLLIVGGMLMWLSCVAFGLYYQLALTLNWLPLVSINVYILAFSLGWGPIPWLVLGELFPLRAKGLASSLAASLNWLLAFIVTKEFNSYEGLVTKGGAFFTFGAICFLSVIFVVFVMIETKGKTLEEIQAYFEGHDSVLNVPAEIQVDIDDPLLQ